MKGKTIIIIIAIVAVIFYLVKTKKVTFEKKKPCPCSTSKEKLINQIIAKNENFLVQLANEFGVDPDNLDLTWLQSKNTEDLTELLQLNTTEFIQEVRTAVSL